MVKRKLHDGLWDHGCLINRPRYFRHVLTVMLYVCAISTIPIFFTSMSSVIVQEANPLWTRTSFDPNASFADAAIFFQSSGDNAGGIEVRICIHGDSNRAAYSCNCCSCDDDSSYSYTSSSSYGSSYYSKEAPNGTSNTTSSSKYSNTTKTPPPALGSSSSIRRYTPPSEKCECGYEYDWDESVCPPQPLSEAFPQADPATNCKDFLDQIKKLHPYNMAWIICGMAVTALIGPLFFVFCVYYPTVEFHTSSFSHTRRYLSPFVGQMFLLVFGLIFHVGMFCCCLMVILETKSLFSEDGSAPEGSGCGAAP